jgi:hypothetical protein
VAAAVFVLAVYTAVLSVMPKDAFWSPDEGAKYIQLHSMAWSAGLRYAIPYGGEHIDPDYAFYPTRCRHEDLYPVRHDDGTIGFHWPIWFPLGSAVLVRAFGPTGLYVVPLVSGWLIALLAGHLMRRWSDRLAPLAILAVGLATPIAFFSLTFWEHTLATLLGLAALALLAADAPPRGKVFVPIVVLLLVAASLRIEMLLFGCAVLCARFAAAGWAQPTPGWVANASQRSRRYSVRTLLLLLSVLAFVVLGIFFSEVVAARHRWLLQMLPNYLVGSVFKLPYLAPTLTAVLIDTAGNQAPVIPDAIRYLVALACLAAMTAPLWRSINAEAFALGAGLIILFNFCLYLILRPQPYVSLHGFLTIAPVIVFAPYAAVSAWRRRNYAQLAITFAAIMYAAFALAAIFVFQVSAAGEMPTGLEWGNRYLFTLYPIGTVLALAALSEYWRSARPVWLKRSVVGAAAALLLCGLMLQARGVWTLIESRRLVSSWQAALRTGPPVVTDVWWLPAAMAPLFIDHELQCIRHARDLGEWFNVAAQHGLDTVTVATFRPFDTASIQPSGFAVETEGEVDVSGLRLTTLRFQKQEP